MFLAGLRVASTGGRGSLRVLSAIPSRNRGTVAIPEGFVDHWPPNVPYEFDTKRKNEQLWEKHQKDPKNVTLRHFLKEELFPDTPPKTFQEIERFDLWGRWKWANDVLYGKDRDMKNFPHPASWVDRDKPVLRHKLLPESWFTALYEKTGVTGPYIIGIGGLLACYSHGIIFFTYNSIKVGIYLFLGWRITNSMAKWGPRWGQWLKEIGEREKEVLWETPIKKFSDERKVDLEKAAQAKNYIQARLQTGPAQIENFKLMLEDEYRSRLQQVYSNVKNKLDYQLALESTKRNFEQEHMINWITDSVTKSITPELEKKNIAACINQLKTLSKTATL